MNTRGRLLFVKIVGVLLDFSKDSLKWYCRSAYFEKSRNFRNTSYPWSEMPIISAIFRRYYRFFGLAIF